MRFFLKYNYIQVDNTCYKDLQTLASGYKVEYVLYIFISPAIFFYLFYLFLSFLLCFNALNHLMKNLLCFDMCSQEWLQFVVSRVRRGSSRKAVIETSVNTGGIVQGRDRFPSL